MFISKSPFSRIWGLNNSTALTQIPYAPPGGGSGGGADDGATSSFDDDSQDPILENQNLEDLLGDDLDLDEGIEDQDEINDDGSDFLAQLYQKKDGEEDDESDDDDEDAGDSPEAQKALADGIRNGISALAIPEAAIPDDFDPTDRKQLKDLLTTIQKDTVQQTMRIMWDPIAAALKQTHVRMRQEWRQGIGEGVNGSQRDQLLDQLIPNHRNPGMSDVVKSLMSQAKKKFPNNVRNQVLATRKAMQGMGIKIGAPKSQGGGSNRQQNRGTRRSTSSVLDNFARLPDAAFGTQSQQDSRLKNRLRK